MVKIEYAFPLISTSLWGVSITGAKIVGQGGYTPIEITFGRFAIASLIFLPIIFLGGKGRKDFIPKTRKAWLALFGLSLTGVSVNNVIFYYGLERTQASVASLLVSLTPLTTMVFAVFMLNEDFSLRKGLSIILGIMGVGLIIGFSGELGRLIGNLMILAAITIWGSSFSFSRRATDEGISSIAVTGWSEILGTIWLIPFVVNRASVAKYMNLTSEIIFWFLFMGILSSVLAYILHYRAIAIFGAGKVAPSTNIIPFSGVISSFLLLRDQISGYPIIGLVLVLTGVVIVQIEKF